MSHSPLTDIRDDSVQTYKNRWSAFTRLLHVDQSFSGGERHCAFLNLEGESFVDISAVTGFDFAEDGRAVVTEDWDMDGDLDVWVSARTAPRIRLLKNDSQQSGDFLFLKLHGDGVTTNPDAIGARCEVWLKDDSRPLTQTLRAGDSFLSQSSSWLHFGLGQNPKIEKVVVHWPAGGSEEFNGVGPGGRYLVRQGQPQVKRWTPPGKLALEFGESIVLPPETEQARIVLPNPLLLPRLEGKDGKAIELSRSSGPILVNLWSSACPTCLHELEEWSESFSQFQAANLEVLALNVDEISLPDSSLETKEALEAIGFPYTFLSANEDTLQRLDLFQRSFLDRWLPLPVPCSFLLDAEGRAVVLYKGPIASKALLSDLTLCGADAETLRQNGTPFSGFWAEEAPFVSPQGYITQFLDYKRVKDVKVYYERYLKLERTDSNPSVGAMVQGLKTLATIATERQKFSAAVAYLEEAIALAPQAPDLQPLLQEAVNSAANSERDLIANLLAKLETEPKNGEVHLALGDAYRQSGESKKAVESYKNALRANPRLFAAAGRLAWILGTHPSPEIRNPKEALAITDRLLSLSANADPNILDLQGIALAVNGNYAAVTESAKAALVLLEDSPYKTAISAGE